MISQTQNALDGKAACPCGSGQSFGACCGALLSGLRSATTAEALMRSRYSANVVGDRAYLLRTWHPRTRPATLPLDPDRRWLGLRIRRTSEGLADSERGTVEFVARFKIGGKGYRLHELSRFERLAEGWLYVDGDVRA